MRRGMLFRWLTVSAASAVATLVLAVAPAHANPLTASVSGSDGFGDVVASCTAVGGPTTYALVGTVTVHTSAALGGEVHCSVNGGPQTTSVPTELGPLGFLGASPIVAVTAGVGSAGPSLSLCVDAHVTLNNFPFGGNEDRFVHNCT